MIQVVVLRRFPQRTDLADLCRVRRVHHVPEVPCDPVFPTGEHNGRSRSLVGGNVRESPAGRAAPRMPSNARPRRRQRRNRGDFRRRQDVRCFRDIQRRIVGTCSTAGPTLAASATSNVGNASPADAIRTLETRHPVRHPRAGAKLPEPVRRPYRPTAPVGAAVGCIPHRSPPRRPTRHRGIVAAHAEPGRAKQNDPCSAVPSYIAESLGD
jgi:hypothetical protein